MKLVERIKRWLAQAKGLRQEEGLTLIEVLAVVVILGIIAAIAVPAVTRAIDQAKLNSTETTLGTLQTALERYYFDEGEYPTSLNMLVSNSSPSGTGTNTTAAWQGPYIKGSFPLNDAWGNPIEYGYAVNNSVNTGYVLLSGDGVSVTVSSGQVSTTPTSLTNYVYAAGGSDASGVSFSLNPGQGSIGGNGTPAPTAPAALTTAVTAANGTSTPGTFATN